ncbi:MAG: hypothetical protein OXQ29_02990 [Rhodospirillaceae bacterium]|nr:hypothetical protein [Rhodospirillaceae bacterium]
MQAGTVTPGATLFRMSRLAPATVLALLWSCAPNGPGQPAMQEPDRQRIVVEFGVPDAAGEDPSGPVQKVAGRILARLGQEIRKTSRTFELLPMIALEADAATIMKLFRMPEVLSIQPDREVEPLGSFGTAIPAQPSGSKTP